MPPKPRSNPYALPRRTSPRRSSPNHNRTNSSQQSSNPQRLRPCGTPRVTGKPPSLGRQSRVNTASQSRSSTASGNKQKTNSTAGPLFAEDLNDLNGEGDDGSGNDKDDEDGKEGEGEGEEGEGEGEDFNTGKNGNDNGSHRTPARVTAAAGMAVANSATLTIHLTGERLRHFNELANTAGLSEEFKIMGWILCNVEGNADQFVSMTVSLLSTRQQVAEYHEETNGKISQLLESLACLTGPGKGWIPSYELRQCTHMIATQCINMGNVQAYTATTDKEGNQEHLPHSLSAKVVEKILKNPSEWRKRLLPARYGRNPDPVQARDFHKWLNVVLKEIRKDLNKILLTNIHIPNRVKKTPSKLNVPTIESMIVKARSTHFYLLFIFEREHDFIGGKVGRMLVVHYGWNSDSYSCKSFWAAVDQKLEDLRSKSVWYRYAYFLEVLRQDFDRFDGERTFTEIQNTTSFELPTEDEVEAQVQHLEATHGARTFPEEAAHEDPE
ncbi:hypothetical protein DFH28DRAFT_902234 [Melampsora americana]|nr:hypothetical protein DFH28DRAFT_902234 [Melampsora americana]